MADCFGRNPVLEALEQGRSINKIWILKDNHHPRIGEIRRLAKAQGIQLVEVDKSFFNKRYASSNHQGVAASLAEHSYSQWQDVLAEVRQNGQTPRFILLDGIEDPHNLGAIIRSAAAFGIHCVIIPDRRAASLTEGTAKSAAGALAHVPVARVGNTVQAIEALKQEGFWIIGTEMNGISLSKATIPSPWVLIIGSEGKGMRPLVRKHCDMTLSIPMIGGVGSLNASVAAGILLYALTEKEEQS